jgi:hypothetical protein
VIWPFRRRTAAWRQDVSNALTQAGVAHAWSGEATLELKAGPLAGEAVELSLLGRRLERDGAIAVDRLATFIADPQRAPRRIARTGRLLTTCRIGPEAAFIIGRSLLHRPPAFTGGGSAAILAATATTLLLGDGQWRSDARALENVAKAIEDPVAWSIGEAVRDVRAATNSDDDLATALCDALDEIEPASKLGGLADWIQWRHPRDRDGPIGAQLVAQLNAHEVAAAGTARVFIFDVQGRGHVEFDHE